MAVNRNTTDNLALQGGEVFIKRAGESEFEYFGATTEFKFAFETETIEHSNSEGSSIVVDAEFVKSKKATVNLTTDSISPAVMASAFGGDVASTEQVSGTVTDEEFLAVKALKDYNLEHFEISDVVITYDTDKTAVENVDYSVNYKFGSVEIAKGGTLVGVDILVDYSYAAKTVYTFGTLNKTSQEVSLMFKSDPQSGKPTQTIAHRVNLSMNGDYSFKSLEDLQTLSFSGKILQDRSKADGQDFVTSIALDS